MKIALDAMGGDDAPAATVAGGVLAAQRFGVDVVLVGQEEPLREELAKQRQVPAGVSIVPATQIIEMAEHPAQAVRQKRDASMVVGMRLVKQGEAAAFVSAGNTGAAMASALLVLGRIRGVERPAIGALVPLSDGRVTLMLDAGANADVRPSHLVQFAQMGAEYLRAALGVANPRIGLLSNGEEPTKGSTLVQEVHALLTTSGLNFYGNVEGKDLFEGLVDVIVTDGFTGNVALKSVEGVLAMINRELRNALTSHWYYIPGALMVQPALRGMAKKFDYSEHGGAPLLGVNGVVIIAHGRSDSNAIANSIRVAAEAVRSGMQDTLRHAFAGAGESASDGESEAEVTIAAPEH
ncbi:MAG TPA: phosphate acyltransferase PlsX [Dehalococcoidia bacterium]|nr:phosphate acyltransferase PlsX [Dehalococcoidia bacterium]